MAVEFGIHLALALFQLLGAVSLYQRRDELPARATSILAALLVLNALLTLFRGLRGEGVALAFLGEAGRLLDLASAFLIAAFVAARSTRPTLRRATVPFLAAAAAWPLLAALAPDLARGWYDYYFSLPYHAAVAALLLATSRAGGWERWVALAFLPRALYFAVQGGHTLFFTTLLAPHTQGPLVVAELAAGVAALVAAARIARAGSPMPALVLAVLTVGPAVALAQISFPAPHSASPTIAILDLVTLALVRPLFLLVGLALDALPRIALRAALGAGVGTAVALGGTAALGWPEPSSALLGLGLALIAVALSESLARPTHATTDAAPMQRRPHWQRILLELRGSSDASLPASVRWTQKEIARRTGISVKRVSEFPDLMNGSAAQRLSAYVAGWRHDPRAPGPRVVDVHKGALREAPGTWVYYRLTADGERLADAVALTGPAFEQSNPGDSGRTPQPPS